MDLTLSAEEEALDTEVRKVLRATYELADEAQGTSDGTLQTKLAKTGLLDWLLPTATDNQAEANRAAIIGEAAGATLASDGFLRAGYVALHVLTVLGQDAEKMRADLLSGKVAALATTEPDNRFSLAPIETHATATGSGYSLSGRKAAILAAPFADTFVVTAVLNGKTALFSVHADSPGLALAPYRTIDGLKAADMTLTSVTGRLIAQGETARHALHAGIDNAMTAIGAEALGVCEAALTASADYAGKRKQFGRPIAKFQSISHRLARMFIECDTLRGGVLNAQSVATHGPLARAKAAHGLKLLIGENGRYVVQQGIQVHGGNGILESFAVARCFKTLISIDTSFGMAASHLKSLADMLE